MEALLEQRSSPPGKRGHVLDEYGCTHGVIPTYLREIAKRFFPAEGVILFHLRSGGAARTE